MGAKRKKRRTHVKQEEGPGKKSVPKSFVFWRGRYGPVLKDLEGDLRKLMQPHTASKLKESQSNQMKDFVSVAGPLGVSQFLILTATANSCYLRIAKVPRGPTLTMRIHKYSLMRDVLALQTRPRTPDSLWRSSPLVIMSNFPKDEHFKLAATLFQNLFPPINVRTAKLVTCQRVLLLSYDRETKLVSLRQYSIRTQPSGVTKAVKQLVAGRQLPDLSGFEDAADFLAKSGYGSESEGEEAASSRVTLSQDLGRGNLASRQSRIVLQELGPRMELEIMKAEEGVCAGRVLYHSRIQKTPQEAAAQAAAIQDKEQLRQKRKKQQEENVRRKAELKKRKTKAEEEEDNAQAAAGGPTKQNKQNKRSKKEWWEKEEGRRQPAEDDDAEYYRQEVGQEPDDMVGLKRPGVRKPKPNAKKRRSK